MHFDAALSWKTISMARKSVPRPARLSVYLYIPNIIGGYWNVTHLFYACVDVAIYQKSFHHLAAGELVAIMHSI